MKTAAQLSEELNLYLPVPEQEVDRGMEMRMIIVSMSMDAGVTKHVLIDGKRGPISPEELEAFGLTNGQEVTDEEFQAIRDVRNAS